MGGAANFAGTTYQQRVLAYLFVHVLAQKQLLWFGTEDDTPESVSGETEGPGDDCAVVFRGSARVVEVQAKHGLTAGAELQAAVRAIFDKLRKSESTLRVVLAVDRASRKVLEVADDLERLRSGRLDPLRAETKSLIALAGDAEELLTRLTIVSVDVDRDDSPRTKEAIVRLEATLKDPKQALAAWRVLVENAGTVSARQWSRIREDLVGILEASRISVNPLAAEEHRSLDVCLELLRGWHIGVARERLVIAEAAFSEAARADAKVQYRLLVLKAGCDRLSGAFDSAIAFARRALEIDRDGLDALRAAGFASLHKGDLAAAGGYAERAVKAWRLDPKAWGLKAQIDAAAGKPPTPPPDVVARSSEHRTVVASIARNREDWAEVLALTGDLLRTGDRDPDVLILRAEALANARQDAGDVAQAAELSTEVIERVRNDDDPLLQRALHLRCALLFDSGDTAGAEADIARLRDISGDTPESLQNAAAIRLKSGDREGALRVLSDPSVQKHPKLLAFRALMRKEHGDDEGALKDARAAHQALVANSPPDVRLAVAEALLDVGDKSDCVALLEDAAVVNVSDPMRFVLLGRVAFLEGRVVDGVGFYRSGAELRPSARHGVLVELASKLKQQERHGEAADTLQDCGEATLTPNELVLLAQCLFDASKVADAQRVIEAIAERGPLPAAALSLAYDIALLSEDRDAAVRHLRTLIGQGVATVQARLELVRLLSESNLRDEARAECHGILESERLPPLIRIQAAYQLASLDGSRLALDAAFRGYREARHDYRAHEGLIVISGLTKEPPLEPESVEPDTYVRLRHGEETREYTVFASGPIDPTRGERTVDEASALGLLGKRVGESIALPGPTDPIEWVIDKILTAAHHGVQEVYSGYEKNFPGRTFLRSFPAPTGESVSEWSPLIRTVSEKAKREDELVRMYWKNGFPLGFMAWALGESIPMVMGRLAERTDIPGLLVEFPAPVAQRAAVEAAKASSQLVLTRSALANAESLGVLDALGERFVLTAPRSLLISLESEAHEAATLAASGRMGLGKGTTGLTAYSLEAGHPDLVSHRDRLAALVRWAKERVRFEPRPLKWLEPRGDTDSPTLRDKIGGESWDAVELAHHSSRPLYADDLGLRRLDHDAKVVQSFSTAALLVALEEEGKLGLKKLHVHLHTLMLARQLYVPASVPLLLAALSRLGEIGYPGVATVLGALATLPTLGEAATMAAKMFKAMVTSPVQVLPLRQVARMALDAMRPGWAVPLIAQEIRRAAGAELRLMPREFREIDRVCGEFVRAG